MSRTWNILAVTTIVAILTQCAPAATRTQGLSGDKRLLSGVVALEFREMSAQPAQQWVLADVRPGERTFPGGKKVYLVSGDGVFDDERELSLKCSAG